MTQYRRRYTHVGHQPIAISFSVSENYTAQSALSLAVAVQALVWPAGHTRRVGAPAGEGRVGVCCARGGRWPTLLSVCEAVA